MSTEEFVKDIVVKVGDHDYEGVSEMAGCLERAMKDSLEKYASETKKTVTV